MRLQDSEPDRRSDRSDFSGRGYRPLLTCDRYCLSSAAARLAQKIHQGLERRPHLATARIIKKKTCRRSWRPLVENSHKPACGEILRNEDWRRLYQRETFDNGLSSDRHRIDAQAALDVDFEIAAFDAKAPGNIGAAWKSDTHAVVPDKIVWRLGFSPLLEISRRTGDDER